MLPQESDRCGIGIGVSTHVIHASGSGSIHSPLTNLDSNSIAVEISKHFSNCDLAMVALCLEVEDAGNRKSFMQNSGKRIFWAYAAWEKKICRRRVFHTFTSYVGRRQKISSIFWNVDVGVQPVGT
ncbi:hypothetical protein JTB14_017242 [Gonioctena quinquepunctata]|nr:hypothetical protein JTB14_017242 [Gonioctena quinquepunctata]